MNCIWNTNNIGGFKRKKRAQRWGIVVAGGIVFCTVEKFYHFIQHKLHLHSLSIWNEWYCILGKGNKRSVVPTWLGEGMEVTVQHSSPPFLWTGEIRVSQGSPLRTAVITKGPCPLLPSAPPLSMRGSGRLEWWAEGWSRPSHSSGSTLLTPTLVPAGLILSYLRGDAKCLF